MLPLESVPNVSEGRDAEVVGAIAAAFTREGTRLLDVHSDPDHHRSVLTLVGDDRELEASLVSGVAAASRSIDLRAHDGVHPRIGAADVVPIVPLVERDMARARAVASTVARRCGEELELPTFLYAESASGVRPAHFRRGGVDELQRRIDSGELRPDFGPRQVDPSVGAVIVGARRPLVAYNVVLRTDDLEAARAVARTIRESSGGLAGVQALGLRLESTGETQVSTNVLDLESTPLHVVAERIRVEAERLGVVVGDAELVGLLPVRAAIEGARKALRLPRLEDRDVLELRVLDG